MYIWKSKRLLKPETIEVSARRYFSGLVCAIDLA